MPSYDMLTEYDFLDVDGIREFDPEEQVFYMAEGGRKVDEGYCRNFVADYKNGLVTFITLWDGNPIKDSHYSVVASSETWFMREGQVTMFIKATGKTLTANPGQAITVKRGQEVVINTTRFRALCTFVNLPEKDMERMRSQTDDFVLEPIPGDGPTGEGPKLRFAK